MILFYVNKIMQNMDSAKVIEVYVEQDKKKYSLEDIKYRAIADAAKGDAKARDWVTKNVITKKSPPAARYMTDQNIMHDAIAGLMALKMKKGEATALVQNMCKNTKYTDAGQIIIKAFKNG